MLFSLPAEAVLSAGADEVQMTLRDLLDGIEFSLLRGSMDTDVTDVILDSRKVTPGVAFVCIEGTKVDSHTFIPQVVDAGAAAVVISHDAEVPGDAAVIRVPDSRLALALMSAAFFGHPTEKMTCIGITGTKGKTTTSSMIKAILEASGRKVGLIGTNGVWIGDEHYPTKNTTPESYELQQRFSQMAGAGCEYAVMEVSSQGIMMNRVAGISFDLGIFTNISPDHIGPDEHKDFEEYLSWKSKLFRMCKVGLVNRDDANYAAMIQGHTCRLYSFSWTDRQEEDKGTRSSEAAPETPVVFADASGDESFVPSFTASNIKNINTPGFLGFTMDYHGRSDYTVRVGIPGDFNVYNALAAVSAADLLGVGPEAVKKAMESVRVNGRMELAHVSAHCSVIIDYAHNGVSARSMLATLRSYKPSRLVVVFGCGGNRDPHRRYEMGEAVGSMADLAVITADNSRFEKVEDIMRDIHKGLDPTGGASIDIPDRREAISYAIENSRPGDLIAVIGKGHEDYQEVNGVRTHFSDREEVDAVLRRLGW